MGFRIQNLGFRVQDSGCGAQGLGFRVQVSEFWVYDLGLRVDGSEFISRARGVVVECRVYFTNNAIGLKPFRV